MNLVYFIESIADSPKRRIAGGDSTLLGSAIVFVRILLRAEYEVYGHQRLGTPQFFAILIVMSGTTSTWRWATVAVMRFLIFLGAWVVMIVAGPHGAAACAITIGWYDRPPTFVASSSGDGPSSGTDMAILQSALADADCAPEWRVQDSWRSIVDGVASGALDLAPWATRTDEREAFAYFTRPYACDPEQLFVRADYAGPAIASLADLAASDLKIGVPAGSVFSADYGESQASGALDGIIVDFAAAGELPDAVLDGRIDGMIRGTLTTAYGFAQRRAWGQVVPTGLVFGVGAIRFMMSRESVSPADFEAIDAALGDLVASERFDAIYEGLLTDVNTVRPYRNGVYGCR